MKLLLHLVSVAFLFSSFLLRLCSVFVGASSLPSAPLPSPVSPFLDSMAASSPGGYFADLFLSTALVLPFLVLKFSLMGFQQEK